MLFHFKLRININVNYLSSGKVTNLNFFSKETRAFKFLIGIHKATTSPIPLVCLNKFFFIALLKSYFKNVT